MRLRRESDLTTASCAICGWSQSVSPEFANDLAAALRNHGCRPERDQLAAIVRDLAAVDPTGFDPDCCTLCRRVIVPAGAPHSENCPWSRARAFCTPPPATPEETE